MEYVTRLADAEILCIEYTVSQTHVLEFFLELGVEPDGLSVGHCVFIARSTLRIGHCGFDIVYLLGSLPSTKPPVALSSSHVRPIVPKVYLYFRYHVCHIDYQLI